MSSLKLLGRIVWQWGVRCFTLQHMLDKQVRGLRAHEEMTELCQALRVPEELVIKNVRSVYSRPVGSIEQEVGGTMVGLVALAACLNVDLEALLEREVLRVLAKPPQHFADRNQQKLDLGLVGETGR